MWQLKKTKAQNFDSLFSRRDLRERAEAALVELKSYELIRHTDKFDDPNLPGEMQTTITLKEAFCGTDLNITQEGIPAMIPVEACYMGWQESLTLLAQLVEAEIPDQP